MMNNHPHPELEEALRKLAVQFTAGNVGLTMLAVRLEELLAQTRARRAELDR